MRGNRSRFERSCRTSVVKTDDTLQSRHMALQRDGQCGHRRRDLAATIEFFATSSSRANHGGRRVGRACHRAGSTSASEIAMMRTLTATLGSRFLVPPWSRSPERPGRTLRLPTRHVRRGRHRRDARPTPQRGAQLVSSEVVQYEDRACSALLYPRPEGLLHRARPELG